MATCSYCGTLMWGGITDQGHRFCSETCHQNAQSLALTHHLSVERVEREVRSVHQGACPQCGGAGPVDIYQSHRAVSLIFVTTWASPTHVCCRSCGRNQQIKDLLISLVAGWWGFPFGLIATPVQIIRNLGEMLQPPNPTQPSIALRQAVQRHLVQTTQAEGETIDLSPLSTPESQQNHPTQTRPVVETPPIAPQAPISLQAPIAPQASIAPQPHSPRGNGASKFSKFIRWVLTGLSGLLLMSTFLSFSFVAFLSFGLATLAVFPPLDRAIATRLSWFKSAWVRSFAWIVLFIVGASALPPAPPEPALPSLADVKLCSQPQQGLCQTETTRFVRDTKQLYVSATPHNIPDGTEFTVNLNYTSEPSKSKQLEPITTKAKMRDGKLLLTLEPKSFPIGTYELKLTSQAVSGLNETREFTVWDSAKDVKARAGDALPESEVQWLGLEMCDRSGKPLPDSRLLEPTTFCAQDTPTFKSSMTALGFEAEASSDLAGNRAKVLWRYIDPKTGKRTVANEAMQQFQDSRTGWLAYTLTSTEGFPPGDYELLVTLETRNAKPLYRRFKVKG